MAITRSKTKKKDAGSRPKNGRGLGATLHKGLSKERINQKRGGNFKRLVIEKGKTKTVQFLDHPNDMYEYEQHGWREQGKWYFVPCLQNFGLACPLDEEEDRQISRTSYQFAGNVWSFTDKAVKILTGGQDLAGRIMFRFDRKKSTFMKRTWDISKFDTQPVTHDVDAGDKATLKSTSGLELFNLEEYVREEAERYFGDDMPGSGKKKGKGKKSEPKRTSLDDDDEDEEDAYDEDDLNNMPWPELKKVATGMKIKLVDRDGEKRKRSALVKLILKKQDA